MAVYINFRGQRTKLIRKFTSKPVLETMAPPGQKGKNGPKRKGKDSSGPNGKTQQRSNKKDPNKNGRRDDRAQLGANSTQSSSEILRPRAIPISLQQLLLNVFKHAFLWSNSGLDPPGSSSTLSQNIQTLKTHLFRRDFASAFADASDELLKAYALRWSAGRALGYATIFRSVCETLFRLDRDQSPAQPSVRKHIFCIGGGAGAEVAALAAVWRTLADEGESPRFASDDTPNTPTQDGNLAQRVSQLSVQQEGDSVLEPLSEEVIGGVERNTPAAKSGNTSSCRPAFAPVSITAVDIADWSPILKELSAGLCSRKVPSTKSGPAPLLPAVAYDSEEAPFSINFKKQDVLSSSEKDLGLLISPTGEVANEIALVTLMFTLNELFSTSMSKTVGFLLRLTDLLPSGTILFVVDSPGSYSTVSFGAAKSTACTDENASSDAKIEQTQERKYPMKFLLEHTLLSVAAGKWECLLTDESRWFRRDQAALRYDLGDGIGLEDMRYQIHVYQKLGQ